MAVPSGAFRSGLRASPKWLFVGSLITLLVSQAGAQELEVRRWNHLPIARSFGSLNYAHTNGDIAFDPVLQIQNAEVEMSTLAFGYVHTFELMGKTARIEIRQPWQDGTWTGLVSGIPATVSRDGLADTTVRFAVSLVGAPPRSGRAYVDYRRSTQVETIIGAALGVQLPTGEYLDDKLINIGANRYTFRPQIGVQHKYHNWTFEGTATAAFFTDNDSLLNVNRLEQDPAYTLDGTIEYALGSGYWVAASAGFNVGGETRINGVPQDDSKQDYGWSISAGFPISQSLALKVSYIDLDHRETVGTASRTVSFSLNTSW